MDNEKVETGLEPASDRGALELHQLGHQGDEFFTRPATMS